MKVVIFILALGIGGCAQIDLAADDPESRRTRHFGYVTIYRPSPTSPASMTEVSTVGLWAGNANIGAGYKRERQISISPECRVIFIIDNRRQLSTSIDLISSTLGLSGGEICVAE